MLLFILGERLSEFELLADHGSFVMFYNVSNWEIVNARHLASLTFSSIQQNVTASRDSAKKIDHKIQRGLFIFAVSNSCVNPIIYGR